MSIQAAAVEYSSRERNLASSRLSVLPYIVNINKHRPGGLKTWDGQKHQPAEPDPLENQI